LRENFGPLELRNCGYLDQVKLVTRQAMKNPVFRQTVDSTSQSLYAA
jgi:hypothetical protein